MPAVTNPEVIVSKALSALDDVSPTLSAPRALNRAADAARVDRFELSCALAQCDIDKLGFIDLLRIPNDRFVRDAVRDDNQEARKAITAELRRRSITHTAAVFRCSTLWLQAAIYRWDIVGLWDENVPLPIPQEAHLDSLTPGALKDLLSRTFDHYKNMNEVAFALGVSVGWLIHAHKKIGGRHVEVKSAYVPRERKGQALRLAHPEEATAEQKGEVLKRMLEIGSLARWAQEANISLKAAQKQARVVGYHAAKASMGQMGVRATIIGWLESSEYPEGGVSTPWIQQNVTLDYHERATGSRERVKQVMRELGFTYVRKEGTTEYTWLKPAGEPLVPKPVFVDDGKPLGPFDLSPEKIEQRRETRQQLLSGAVAPTPDRLRIAGLVLR